MISQEEVCIWFKNLEGYSRIELMCALLDSCLPLELRFLGTYLEYSAGKHYTHLQKWEKDANKSSSWLTDKDSFSNKEFRRRFCIFLALLHSHNRTIAVRLFEILNQWEYISDNECIDSAVNSNDRQNEVTKNDNDSNFSRKLSFYNEMRLLFTMASLHPALDFSQRSNLRTKKENFTSTCSKPEPSVTTDDLQEDEDTLYNAKQSENHKNIRLEEDVEQGPVQKSIITSTSAAPLITTAIASQTPITVNIDANKASNTKPLSDPAPMVSRTATGQTLQQIPIEKYYLPPYRTHPLMPQLAGPVIHKPLEQQQLHFPVMQRVPPPIQCVVNNQHFIQNNISLHTNTTTKSNAGNVFSQTERGIGLPKQSSLNTNNVIPPTIPLVSPNIYTTRTLDSLSGTVFAPPDPRKQFTAPQFSQNAKIANGPIINPSLDDSSLPSHVYSVSITITCNGLMKDTSSVVTTVSSIPTHTISRRCLSESDAQDRLQGSQEQLLNNIIIPKTMPLTFQIPVEQKNDGSMSNIHFYNSIPSGYSPVRIPNLHPNNPPNYQTMNLTESNSTKQVVYSYNSPQPQLQQPTVQSPQPPVSCNISNSPLLPTHFILPTTTTTTKEDRPVLSPNKTIPTGINGTYLPAHVLEGLRPSNVYSNDIDKLELITNKNHYNTNISTNKSLPIPVQQQRRSFTTGKFTPDIVESPCSSPSQSPRLSPFCSPVQSPISKRKGVSSPKLEIQDIYASTTNWLKSMRLHKYSDTLENYSFEELKELDEEDFKQLGLTLGASNKIKQQIELLSSRGLKEFGHPENLINPELPQGGGSSNVSPASLSPVIGRYLNAGAPQSHPQSTDEIPRSSSQVIEINQHDERKNIEKEGNSTQELSNQKEIDTMESSPTNSDDDVFALRKRSELATCYNCGHVGHYGDECTEQTMESLTYSRYSFQLDYSRSTQEQPTTAANDDTKISTTAATTTTISVNR